MLFKLSLWSKIRLAVLIVIALLFQLVAPYSVVFAGINDIFAYGYSIGNNLSGDWAPGNLGKTYEEGEWVAFQTQIQNLDWNQIDRIGVAFDFYDGARFYDLVRNISVGTTLLPQGRAFPNSSGGAYPLTSITDINIAQREPNEYIFSDFDKIEFSDTELKAQVNVVAPGEGDDRFDETRIFYITEQQVLEANPALANSSSLVIYFQLHLSRTFLWNNTGMFDEVELPLAYAYSDPLSPTYNWGGYVYDEDFLTSGGAPYTMKGSAAYPGSSGHSYVYTSPGSGQKTIPIPDIGEETGMISGYKFNDLDGDGIWDVEEPALSNWDIFLRTDLYAIEDLEWSRSTNGSGYFEFTNLPYNLIYELTEELQTGYSQTSPYSGIAGAGSYNPDGNVETTWWKVAQELNFEERADWGWSVKLAPGHFTQTNVNFGNRQAGYLTISKTWDDMGTGMDLPESVSVLIKDSENAIVDTLVLTQANNWTDTSLALVPGTYTFEEVTVPGWSPVYTPANRTLIVAAGDIEDAEIGSIANTLYVGSLTVFKVISNPEMIPDTMILPDFEITISGMGYTDTQTIDDGGEYTWFDLVPGNYTVTEGTLGIEWQVSITNNGAATVVAGVNTEVTVTNTYVLQYHDETMWAYYEGKAIPFTDVAKNLKNWGWTNGPFVAGESIVLDLYAGAGGNDISGLDPVGTVEVVFNGDDTITVIYDTDHEMTSIHFFIGSGEDNMLPKNKNKFTNSPGQFPYDESDGELYSDGMHFKMTIPFEFLEDIYIAAHGVVRIYE